MIRGVFAPISLLFLRGEVARLPDRLGITALVMVLAQVLTIVSTARIHAMAGQGPIAIAGVSILSMGYLYAVAWLMLRRDKPGRIARTLLALAAVSITADIIRPALASMPATQDLALLVDLLQLAAFARILMQACELDWLGATMIVFGGSILLGMVISTLPVPQVPFAWAPPAGADLPDIPLP